MPIRINPRYVQSNPLYWSASAIVDDAFVVKYAWSEVRATRVVARGRAAPATATASSERSVALPEVVALSRDPALLVTRLVDGEPMSWEWASGLSDADTDEVGGQLAQFLAELHAVDAADLLDDLPVVHPTAQADTERLRRGFPRLVDERRAAAVLGWCDWVDDVLGTTQPVDDVVAHGDLHGYNQVWDRTTRELRVVVDLEECGVADPHFDLRYLPGNAEGPRLLQSVMSTYASTHRTALGRLTSPGLERPHPPGRCAVANRGPGPVARRRHPHLLGRRSRSRGSPRT